MKKLLLVLMLALPAYGQETMREQVGSFFAHGQEDAGDSGLVKAFDDNELAAYSSAELLSLGRAILTRHDYNSPSGREALIGDLEKIRRYLKPWAASHRFHYKQYKFYTEFLTELYGASKRATSNEAELLNVSEEAYKLGVIGQRQLLDQYMNSAWQWILLNDVSGWKEAERLGRRGLSRDPQHAGLAVNYFHALALLGKADEAQAVFNRYANEMVELPEQEERFTLVLTNDFEQLKKDKVWNKHIEQAAQNLTKSKD